MRRHQIEPRPDWRETVRAQGMLYSDTKLDDGATTPYWDESACYSFTLDEVLRLEEATEELHRMCLAAAAHVVERGRFAEFGIPEWARAEVSRVWREQPPTLYGRFDLWYDGSGPPKMLEYNADTPTSLIEASIIQWFWLTDTRPGLDQWNSLHERLIEGWRGLAPRFADGPVHFAWSNLEETFEDLMTVGYLADTAHQAGLDVRVTPMLDIAWDGRRFRDSAGDPINTIFKLYPWEWMVAEPYGRLALDPGTPTTWIEPAWKLLLSNKALLAVLWELYPGHELLLPAYLDGPRDMTEYVAKALLGREGANVRIVTAQGEQFTDGIYGEGGHCFQEFRALPSFDGNHVVLGSWIIDGEAAGLGLRESTKLITDGHARFIPHYVDTPRTP
ncbi:putative glutathionylspermidine synthase [Catellatospora sp. IY07-71]|uniref:glutathionylspermidine synthase family protein n=1 Tax=Catellatospora sp. IY07-71 TaxID=2728827 RepID=UPI001BB307D6|nr:glutathionylspermidine synthase family protein [Catellatospora sp. IY07-71]BCJ71323.1 putative glutathionylspermidine synthase [Catellatospora sp. IY07-71]